MHRLTVTALGAVASLLIGAGAALAEDRAVIIGGSAAPGFQPDAVAQQFRVAGFATTVAQGLTGTDLPRPLAALEAPDPVGGSRVVILAGHFVSAGGEVWLLGSDANRPGLASVDRFGVGVSRVVSLMRDGSGPRILMLAEAPGGATSTAGARLSPGIGPMTRIAGVSVVAGPASAVARGAALLAGPNGNLATVLIANPELRVVSGPATTGVVITRGQPGSTPPGVVPPGTAPTAPTGAGGLTTPALPGEAEAWVVAAAQNDEGAYTDFLNRFPAGRYANVARQRLTRLGVTPPAAPATPAAPTPTPTPATPDAPAANQSAALSEIRLNLSLGERSQIQRILTDQGFDTAGSDGQFGRGTRDALRRWQGSVGLPATGYVDQQSLRRLRQLTGLR